MPPEPSTSEPLHVLVVDDEDAVRRMLTRLLEREGHRVDQAADGAQAMDRLRNAGRGYDVILSDVRMPGLSGPELLACMCEQDVGAADRVVFITGDSLSDDAQAMLAGTRAPVLSKPFDLAEVRRTVEDVGRRPRG